jgi:3-hydroxyisobutyrate dehydrogenase-like beta-hydroxyacid dehydrogenase
MDDTVIGCIGLGVMGEPICANLVRKSGARVRGFDLRTEPLSRLAEQGLERAATAEDAARDAAVVFLSLPGGAELAEVATRLHGVMRPGSVLVDLSTAPVDLTRELAARFAAGGLAYADAPVARTRLAAERGESARWSEQMARPSRASSATFAALQGTCCTAEEPAAARSQS